MFSRLRLCAVVCSVAGLVLLAGCASAGPSTAVPSRDEHGKLLSVLQGYQLPKMSIAPTTNPDPDVQRAIVRMSQIAVSQGLVFDGSRVKEGIVVVGRQGSAGPMLLALSVYNTPRGVATQDSYYSRGTDVRDLIEMRDRFFSELR